jgi:hypothetical protein
VETVLYPDTTQAFQQFAEKLAVACFWVAQRFTAAISGLFPMSALAAEVGLRRGKQLLE